MTTDCDLDLVREYLRAVELRGRAPSTLLAYEHVIRQAERETGRPAHLLTRDDLHAWLSRLDPNAADFRMRHLRGWFRWLHDEGIREDTPVDGLRFAKRDAPMLTATDEQVRAMLSQASTPRDKAVLHLLTATGMRRSECGLLQRDDVVGFIDNGAVRVSASKTRPRIVWVDGSCETALRRWLRVRPDRGQSLWCVQDGPAMVAKTVRRCSDGSLTTHSLRRWFASTWLRDGGSETSLVRMCGWASTAMVATYTRAVADEVTASEYQRLRR